MRNITISVDEEVAKWTRVWAARNDTSVSRAVGELLRKQMEEELGYEKARQSFLRRKPTKLRDEGGYPTREELHDRDVLR